jgi:hypothetical protein
MLLKMNKQSRKKDANERLLLSNDTCKTLFQPGFGRHGIIFPVSFVRPFSKYLS